MLFKINLFFIFYTLKVLKSSKIKGYHLEYKKKLNGKIEYVSPKIRDSQGFEGFMKLAKDPKGQIVNENNFAQRGSVLLSVDWALGIALYCGNDCCDLRNTCFSKGRTSFFN